MKNKYITAIRKFSNFMSFMSSARIYCLSVKAADVGIKLITCIH
jgi:hypothetical protein